MIHKQSQISSLNNNVVQFILRGPKMPCVLWVPLSSMSSLEFYEFPRVEFHGFKWVQMSQMSSLYFLWVPLCSFEFPWEIDGKRSVEIVPIFSWLFLTCFFLRALSYSCWSIFQLRRPYRKTSEKGRSAQKKLAKEGKMPYEILESCQDDNVKHSSGNSIF